MTSAPSISDMTRDALVERIGQIDKAIIAAEDSIDRVPTAFEESTSGDDNATESEGTQQALGGVGMELEQLRLEKAALQAELDTRDKQKS
jgi:hypothetical protein